jgi:hypothetical protein
MAKPIEIPIKISGVTELRSEIKRLQGELINATDPEEVGRLSSKIGELKDQFSNVNEQAAIFASGSKYEQVNNALGATGSALANLDFGKAEERARALAQAAGNITFKDAITSVKQLGNTFLTLGKALLTNPLFLLAAVIGGIVIGIVKLLDKLGVFKKAMEALGSAIDFVVQLMKDFLDLIGLTDFAGEEAAQKEKKRLGELMKERTLAHDQNVKEREIEIARLKAVGASIEEIEDKEIELAKVRAENAKAELKAQERILEAQIKALKALGQTNVALDFQKQLNELRNNALIEEIALIDKKASVENARAGREKKQGEEAKKAREDKEKAQAQFDAQRLAVERQLEDLRISQIEDETKRTLAENKVKYERLIADTLANENLLEIEKQKLIQEFKNQKLAADNVIYDKEAAEAKKRNDQKIEEEKRAQEELSKILKDAQIEKEQIAEAEKVLRQGVVDASIAAFGQLSNLLGQSTKAGKVAALADIATQTAVGFVRGLDIAQKGAQATGPAAPFAFPLFYAQQIGAVLGAANQAKSILKGGSASGGSSSGGGGSFGGQAPPQPAQPSFNLFGGANDFNNVQAPQSVEANQPQVVRAVVSETDLRNTNTRLGTILNTSQL